MAHSIVSYPLAIERLGGASYVRHNARSAWVYVGGKFIRLPFKEIKLFLDDGFKVADIAKTWAYRNS